MSKTVVRIPNLMRNFLINYENLLQAVIVTVNVTDNNQMEHSHRTGK